MPWMADRIEHRRVLAAGGAFTPDTDWAANNTLPTFGADLAAGEVVPFVATGGAVLIWAEQRAANGGTGIDDDATFVASGTWTFDAEVLAHYRVQGGDSVAKRAELTAIPGQQQQVELELPTGTPCWVRLTGVTNYSGGADAIWLYVDTRVEP